MHVLVVVDSLSGAARELTILAFPVELSVERLILEFFYWHKGQSSLLLTMGYSS